MRLKLLFVLLLFAAAAPAQTVDSLWQGWLSPFVQTGGTAPAFTFQGLFNANTGFSGSQIDLAQQPRLIVFSSNECYELPIDSIISSGSVIAGRVQDPSGRLSALPGGMAAIYHPSAVNRVGPFISGLSASLQGCLQTFTNLKIDSLNQSVQTDATLEGNGTAISPLKIAAQGATGNQVLKWNGTTWLPADDAGSEEQFEAFPSIVGDTISPALPLPASGRQWRINLYRTGVRMSYGLDFTISGGDILLSVPGQDEAFLLILK